MKKIIISLVIFSFLIPLALPIAAKERISDHKKNDDALYRQGTGAIDGAFTATSLSMLGWGVGLAAGIGILCAVLHQSTASHNAHCH